MRVSSLVGATAALALLGAVAGYAENEPFTWTISGSSVDPFQSTGTFTPGLETIYLWLACCDPPPGFFDGMEAAEFGIINLNPANEIVSATAASGFRLVKGDAPSDFLIDVAGCVCGPVRVADILTLSNAPGSWCFAPSKRGIELVVQCGTGLPITWPFAWTGYANDGTLPCTEGEICKEWPVAVDRSSFGRVKVLYR